MPKYEMSGLRSLLEMKRSGQEMAWRRNALGMKRRKRNDSGTKCSGDEMCWGRNGGDNLETKLSDNETPGTKQLEDEMSWGRTDRDKLYVKPP